MKRSLRILVVFLLMLTFVFTVNTMTVFAADDPSFSLDGVWSDTDKTVTLTGSVSSANAFYAGSVAIDYDTSLFDVKLVTANGEQYPAKPEANFSMFKNEDKPKGHILTVFGYMGENGGGLTSSAADSKNKVFEIVFELKSGKTKDDIKEDSIKLCDEAEDIDGLDDSIILKCEKNGNVTSFGYSDDKNKAYSNGVVISGLSANVPVTGVTLTPDKATIKVGETVQLTATIQPDNATNKTITWTSSDPTIASVSTTGVVTGLKAGTVTITATVDGKTATSEVTVTAPKTISKIDPSTATTTAGTKPTLPSKVKVTYSDGTTGEVSVKWDDIPEANYASAGTFKVYGTVEGTDIRAECTVTVNPKSTGGPTNPGTGDNIRAIAITSALLVISLIVIIAFIISRKKNSSTYGQ